MCYSDHHQWCIHFTLALAVCEYVGETRPRCNQDIKIVGVIVSFTFFSTIKKMTMNRTKTTYFSLV